MKLIYKSFFWLVVGSCFILQPLYAQTSGGPDSYGYTWKTSSDPEGPVFEWIDITTTGTEVMGLKDDNSAPIVNMDLTFNYYWSEFDQIKMGSNGWLSFDDVSNVAHCFPSIPFSGRGNNILAPLMSDLNFDGSINPAQLFYLNDGAGKFIVSYINVPFYTNDDPQFRGSNTFQVILDSNDNSITFNYLDVESGIYSPNASCETECVIGIENITGTIGLEVAVQMIPENNTAIRFESPEMSTYVAKDISAAWNSTADNLAKFYMPDDEIPTIAGLKNTGNVEITSQLALLGRIRSNSGVSYQKIVNIDAPAIPAGETVEIALPPLTADGVDNVSGNYSFDLLAGLTGDIVSSNNQNVSEFSVVDISSEDGITLSYVRAETPTGQAALNGSGGNSGFAVYMEPPFYPATIKSVEMFVLGDPNNADDAFSIQIYDDDGTNGSPGTLIGLETVDGGTYNSDGEWIVKDLSFAITITSGGFYVTWVKQGNVLAIGTETTAPFSRQTFELIGGAFSQYRSNETADMMIRTVLENPFFVSVDNLELDKGVNVFPNPTYGVINIDNQLADDKISRVQVYNTLGQIILDQPINIAAGDLQSIDLDNQPPGIYYLNIQADKAQITRKISLSK